MLYTSWKIIFISMTNIIQLNRVIAIEIATLVSPPREDK
jgi:hypothetical protein